MADPVKTVTIKADASQYKSEISSASAATREITAELGAMKARGGATAAEQAKLTKEVTKAKAAFAKARAEASTLSKRLDDVKRSGGASKSEVARLEKSIASASSRAKIASANLDKLGHDIQSAGQKARASESGFESASKAMSALKAAAVVAAVKGASEWLGEAARETIKYQAVQKAAKISVDEAAAATRGLINEYDLMVAANAAVQGKVVRTKGDFADLAKAATKLGLAAGKDATQSVSDLSEALAKNSSEVLNNLGIYLTKGQALDAYADKLGKTTAELTETEAAEAFAVIGLERAIEAAEATGIQLDEMNTSILEASTKWDDMYRGMQEGAAVIASEVVLSIQGLGESLGDAVVDITALGDETESLMEKMKRLSFVANRDAGKALAPPKEEILYYDEPTDLTVGPTSNDARINARVVKDQEKAARAAKAAQKEALRRAKQQQQEMDALVDQAIAGIAAEAEAREAVSEFYAVYDAQEAERIELAKMGLDEEMALLDMRLGAAEEGSAAYMDLLDQRTAAELAQLELRRSVSEDEIELAEIETEKKKVQLANQLEHARAAAEAEKKVQAQRAKYVETASRTVAEAVVGAAQASADAAEGEEHAAARSIQAYAKALRNKMIITAVTEAALAVASAASFNAVGAAAHGAAAVQAGAAAVVAAGVAGAAGSIAGPETSGADGFRGGTEPAADAGAGSGQNPGQAAKQLDVPVSQDPITSGLKAVPERPLSITVVLEGPIFAQDKAEVGRWINGAIAEARGYD